MYANINEYLGMYTIPKSNLNEKYTILEKEIKEETKTDLQFKKEKTNPKIWGPSFWFTLHTSAAFYPLLASPIVRERMKNRILAIPYEIPCPNCRIHAIDFIEKHRNNLDKIVSGRHSLGSFYVDFHNQVNKRYNKPLWNYEQAYQLYSGEENF